MGGALACILTHVQVHTPPHAHTCTHKSTRVYMHHSASWRGRCSALLCVPNCALFFTLSAPSCPRKKAQRSRISPGCCPLLTASRAPRWVLEGARRGRGATGNFDERGRRWGSHTGDSDCHPSQARVGPGGLGSHQEHRESRAAGFGHIFVTRQQFLLSRGHGDQPVISTVTDVTLLVQAADQVGPMGRVPFQISTWTPRP